MKYTSQIVIELPRTEVIAKMDSMENLQHWQKGLLEATPLTGEPGKEGSQMKLSYKMGKREMEMIETIIENDFPEEFHATYDTKGVHNIQHNYFNVTGENQTTWISESEFKFSNLSLKFLGYIMPNIFKKQSLKYMKDFKAFAEEGTSVKNT